MEASKIIKGIVQSMEDLKYDYMLSKHTSEKQQKEDTFVKTRDTKRFKKFNKDRKYLISDGFHYIFRKNGGIAICFVGEYKLNEVDDYDFENNLTANLADLKKFLLSQYKVVTGKTLKLKDNPSCPDVKIEIQPISAIRVHVTACKEYLITDLQSAFEDDDGGDDE